MKQMNDTREIINVEHSAFLREEEIGDLRYANDDMIIIDHIQQSPTVEEACQRVCAGLYVQLLVVNGELPLARLNAGAEQYVVVGEDQKWDNAVENLEAETG